MSLEQLKETHEKIELIYLGRLEQAEKEQAALAEWLEQGHQLDEFLI